MSLDLIKLSVHTLSSIIHQWVASRPSSRLKNKCLSSMSSRYVRLKRSIKVILMEFASLDMLKSTLFYLLLCGNALPTNAGSLSVRMIFGQTMARLICSNQGSDKTDSVAENAHGLIHAPPRAAKPALEFWGITPLSATLFRDSSASICLSLGLSAFCSSTRLSSDVAKPAYLLFHWE